MQEKREFYTISDLYARGWIDPLIGELPPPTMGKHPDRPSSGKRVPLWRCEEVEACERQPRIREQLARIEGRRTRRTKQRERRAEKFQVNAKKLCERLHKILSMEALALLTDSSEQANLAWAYHEGICQAICDEEYPREHSDRIAAEKVRASLSPKTSKGSAIRFAPSNMAKGIHILLKEGETGPMSRLLQDQYASMLCRAAIAEQRHYMQRSTRVSVQEMLDLPDFPSQKLLEQGIYQIYLMDYIPARIRMRLSDLIAVNPKDEYPLARMAQRQFIIHVGGTNTGKTYQSLLKLSQADSGAYLAPLRLLALEVQDNMLGRGVNCSLLTGEEEDLREGSTHISSTVEKADVNRPYDVVVIDECQMIQDRDRGFAWTRAILGVCANEIHLCTAPEALDLLIRMIEDCGEPYTVEQHERTVPLTWMEDEVTPEEAQHHDAFIAFSKRNVLMLSNQLNRLGKPASVIYGALPYATRCLQMERFLKGETKVLVATDAIGMGLNLPIRRVIFTSDTKFDGIESRPLKPAEIKQIAGRAGRLGVFDHGYATSIEPSDVLEAGFHAETPKLSFAVLGFSDLVLRVGHDLLDVLQIWNEIPSIEPYRKMDVTRYIIMIQTIRNANIGFSPDEELRAASIPFDEREETLLQYFLLYCDQARNERELTVPVKIANSLDGLERYSQMLDLYYSCSRNFHQEIDLQWLRREKEENAAQINQLLVSELAQKGKSCRMCHAPMPIDSSFRICKRCADKMRSADKGRRHHRR